MLNTTLTFLGLAHESPCQGESAVLEVHQATRLGISARRHSACCPAIRCPANFSLSRLILIKEGAVHLDIDYFIVKFFVWRRLYFHPVNSLSGRLR
jgi:hypothetical protein